MNNEIMIELKSINKSYGSLQVVNDLTMTMQNGEITVLIGPSGCGKTTTLEMINGLIIPDAGQILVDEVEVAKTDLIALRRRIGYVIQEIGLFPHYTVAENIGLVPRLLKWDEERVRQRVEEMMELVNIPTDRLDKYPAQLSGGQQQRVGVARALAADPEYLLMDEPFSAVDPVNRSRLQDEFLHIQQRLKKTIIFVTHDMDEALKLGDQIAVFDRGKLLQHAAPLQLLRNPANEFVAQFMGEDRSLKALRILSVSTVKDNIIQALSHTGTFKKNDLPRVTTTATLQQVLERLLGSAHSAVTVVDDQRNVIGMITLDSFNRVLKTFSGN